nr:immunoglobulin light chain junction region [Macaca mulatta]
DYYCGSFWSGNTWVF